TVIGARVALEDGAPALICVIMGVIMGVVTGSAGGLLRDVLCAEVPLLLRRDVYALAAMAGASLYVLLEGSGVAVIVSAPLSVGAVFAIRLAAIRWDLHAPTFELEEEDRPG
ncbi:MAG: trimeric intracellular cation channel family protein, partial [Nocardioides sp.]